MPDCMGCLRQRLGRIWRRLPPACTPCNERWPLLCQTNISSLCVSVRSRWRGKACVCVCSLYICMLTMANSFPSHLLSTLNHLFFFFFARQECCVAAGIEGLFPRGRAFQSPHHPRAVRDCTRQSLKQRSVVCATPCCRSLLHGPAPFSGWVRRKEKRCRARTKE